MSEMGANVRATRQTRGENGGLPARLVFLRKSTGGICAYGVRAPIEQEMTISAMAQYLFKRGFVWTRRKC